MLLDKNLKFDFSARSISTLLTNELSKLNDNKFYRILDVGCGDGVMIYDLERQSLLKKNFNLTAIDILPDNIKLAKKRKLNANFLVADAEQLPYKRGSFDFVYTWMVLEHVPSPRRMVLEIARVLKKNARCYIATVIRKKWAIYIYRKDGHFTLDPTHIHEFESKEELCNILKKNGLKINLMQSKQCKYSLTELQLKLMLKLGIIKPSIENRQLFVNNQFLEFIKKNSQIPIPGFQIIEAVCEKYKS